MTSRSFSLPRTAVVVITAVVIFMPLGLIFWQSFLNAPFFNPAKHFSFDAYAFIFEDADFWSAFLNSFVIAVGSYVQPLTDTAIQTAEKIGPITVDMGNTSCQVPFAPDSIRKVQKRGAIGKKRKSAKC